MKIANPNFVVGIGASAGGLNAYKAFFEALSSDTGMAFVVISHIYPTAHSQLTEILSRLRILVNVTDDSGNVTGIPANVTDGRCCAM